MCPECSGMGRKIGVDLDVIKNADWIIDLGPEGGNKGGKVIFEGTPQQLLSATHSLTSVALGTHLS